MAKIEPFIRNVDARPVSVELGANLETTVIDKWPVKIADLSFYQGTIDFAKLATKVQGVVLRAAYGNKFIDTKFYEYYRGATDNGLVVKLYHYLKPSANCITHADTIISVERDYPAISIWGDLEENGGLSKIALEGWIKKYFDRVLAQKEKTGIYSSKGFLDANLGKTNWLKNLALWIAAWTNADQPLLPNEYVQITNPKTWTLWQWTAKGDGKEYGVSSKSIDLNRFNGSIEVFNAVYGTHIKPLGEQIPPPPPIPEPQPEPVDISFPKTIEITSEALTVRTSAKVADTNKIGAVKKGTRFVATGTDASDPNWYAVKAYLHKNYTKDVK